MDVRGYAKLASIETNKSSVASKIPTSVDLMRVSGVYEHGHMCDDGATVSWAQREEAKPWEYQLCR